MSDLTLTPRQAAIIGCYTGTLCGPFADFQDLAEQLLERPVLTHEFGDKATMQQLRACTRELFLSICPRGVA